VDSFLPKDQVSTKPGQLQFSLQPLDHPNFIVNLVHEAKLCERFPEDSLAYLDAVVGNKPQLPPRDLKHCLEGILELRPDLEEDDGFRRLRDYLREYGGT